MKASDIADAVSALEIASAFILRNAPAGDNEEGEIRYKLLKSASRLRSYLDVIDMKVKDDRAGEVS